MPDEDLVISDQPSPHNKARTLARLAACGALLAGAAVAMGAFDRPTNTSLKMNIFVAEKGDYYEITDGVPQH